MPTFHTCMRTKIRSLIAVAALGAVFGSTANAAVIYLDNQEIPIPTTFAGVSVDLETGGNTTALAGAVGMDLNFLLGGAGITNDADQNASTPTVQFVRTGTGNTDSADNLTIGTIVGPGSITATGFGGSGGTTSHFLPFVDGVSGYIGFEMEIAGPTTVYGWIRVTLSNESAPGVIHEWAYDDTGAPLAVGVIPEPSLPLLSFFSLVVLALRRRR